MTTRAATTGIATREGPTDVGPVPATVTVRGAIPAGLDAATAGTTATALAELYDAVRDAFVAAAAEAGGGVLIVVDTDEPRSDSVVAHALGAMSRSLARESGYRGVRVNAVLTSGAVPTAMLDFIASPASALLTGAVFDAR